MNTTYIHGFSAEEQQRLSAMQEILNARQLEHFDFCGIKRVLDVGSGLGQLTQDIASRLPDTSTVIAIENNGIQRRAAIELANESGAPGTIEFREGDAYSLPLKSDEQGSFDLVHARFILEHLRHPEKAIAEMANAVRSGGKVFLVDDDHELLRVYPQLPSLEHAWHSYWNSYYDLGYDPLIGRRLPELLRNVGINEITTGIIHYGATQGEMCFDLVVDNLIGVIAGSADHLIQQNRMSRQQLDHLHTTIESWRINSNATIWYPLPYVIGTKV